MLTITNVRKTFNKGTVNEKKALCGISLHLCPGDFVTVIGGNGAGKSTMLNMIAGVYPIDSGKIEIDGVNISREPEHKRARYIGRVFQDPMRGTAAGMEIQENLALALRRGQKRGLSWGIKPNEKDFYREALTKLDLGLQTRMTSKVGLLSGGQRQALTLLMATLEKPKLLLLDEPFAAIDAKVRKELRRWLKEMIEKVGITSIFVTHDQEEAVEVADDILIINEGKLEQIGSPIDIYKNPKTPFVAQFIGTSVILDSLLGFKGYEDIPNGKKVIVRPEFVEAFKSDNQKFAKMMNAVEEGVIETIVFRGSYLELTLRVKGVRLTTHRSLERRHVEIGEKMCVLLYRVYLFDENGAQIRKNELLKGIDVEAL